jgi:hypothetical protein
MINKIKDDLLMRKMAGRRPALTGLNHVLRAIKENKPIHLIE